MILPTLVIIVPDGKRLVSNRFEDGAKRLLVAAGRRIRTRDTIFSLRVAKVYPRAGSTHHADGCLGSKLIWGEVYGSRA